MKQFIKENSVLLIAFGLPVIVIVVIALNLFLPSLFLSTKYNFIYSTCSEANSNYYYPCSASDAKYSVIGSRLVVAPSDPNADYNKDGIKDINQNNIYTVRLFLHNTDKNESREITLSDAQTMILSGLLTSPDGVTVSNSYTNTSEFPFVFGGRSNYGFYLMKGKSKQKLNLINQTDQYYYQNNFKFIGWVMQ
jgi:hypothetical protein